MPNYEELAKGMSQPFGGVSQMTPPASPLIRSGETMNSVYRAWPNSLAKALVGLATGWKSDPEPELNPMEKAYEIASPAMFATSKFKGMYPTFEAYAGRMKELGIPLDLLGKQKAKGFYKEVPANEAEYLARAGETPVGKVGAPLKGRTLLPDFHQAEIDVFRKQFSELPIDKRMDLIARERVFPVESDNTYYTVTAAKRVSAAYMKNPKDMAEATSLYTKLQDNTMTEKQLDRWLQIDQGIRSSAADLYQMASNPDKYIGDMTSGIRLRPSPPETPKPGLSQDWSSIKSAIESIPRHKSGGLDFLTDLRAKFPDMPKGEFDEMMLKLSREGKISLHHHDMPGSYKGEMIKDGKTFYHAFGVKPEWR